MDLELKLLILVVSIATVLIVTYFLIKEAVYNAHMKAHSEIEAKNKERKIQILNTMLDKNLINREEYDRRYAELG